MSQPAERHAAFLGIEEAEQQVRDRRLAGAARPDERDPPAWLEPQVEAAQRRRLSGRVAGGDTLEGHDRGKRGAGRGSAGSRTAGSRSTSSNTRRPAAIVAESSRAAAEAV